MFTLVLLGHLQTITGAILRQVPKLGGKYFFLLTPDGDWIDGVYLLPTAPSKGWVILTHGLEGFSEANYLLGMAHYLRSAGYGIVAWNMRGCGSRPNETKYFYHSGFTNDLFTVVDWLHHVQGAQKISLVGFSLGGNLTLKATTEATLLSYPISAVVSVSAPLSLEASVIQLLEWDKSIYQTMFLKSLRKKVVEKYKLMPDEEVLNPEKFQRIKSLLDFDELYTAPIHGYESAKAYYADNQVFDKLNKLLVPSLVIAAKNDPLLTTHSFPEPEGLLHTYYPNRGGHCGFGSPFKNPNDAERVTLEFLNSI